MRTSLTFLVRFLLGAILAWLLGFVLIRATGSSWHRLGGRNPVDPLHSFLHTSAPVDLVFFGTSSTRNAIVPEILEQELEGLVGHPISVWNLALPNATPEIGTVLAEDFFAVNKPRFLIIEAAPFLWDGDRGDDADFSVYWRWFSTPTALFTEGRPLRRQDALSFLRNFDRDWEDIWSTCPIVRVEDMRPQEVGLPPQGGLYRVDELDQTPNSQPVDIATPTREARRVSHYSTPEIWQQELERLLALCQEKGIQVILLHQPVYADLLPMFEAGSYQAFLDWIEGVAESHDLPFLMLQNQIPMEVPDFRDYIHYSPQGARHFSTALAPFLAPYLLQAEQEGAPR